MVIYQPLLHIFMNKVNIAYWYIYMVLGLYLVLPFIRKIVDNCNKKEIEIFLTFFILVKSIIPGLVWIFRNDSIMN